MLQVIHHRGKVNEKKRSQEESLSVIAVFAGIHTSPSAKCEALGCPLSLAGWTHARELFDLRELSLPSLLPGPFLPLAFLTSCGVCLEVASIENPQ
jgi:hypothetical protein